MARIRIKTKGLSGFAFTAGFALLFNLALILGLIYIACHFIAKFW